MGGSQNHGFQFVSIPKCLIWMTIGGNRVTPFYLHPLGISNYDTTEQ